MADGFIKDDLMADKAALGEIEAGYWVSLQEYLALKKVSLSTARRRIKAGLVKAELRKGKYYIYVLWERSREAEVHAAMAEETSAAETLLAQQVRYLQQQVQSLRQENSDLRMLVQAYEVKLAHHHSAPCRDERC